MGQRQPRLKSNRDCIMELVLNGKWSMRPPSAAPLVPLLPRHSAPTPPDSSSTSSFVKNDEHPLSLSFTANAPHTPTPTTTTACSRATTRLRRLAQEGESSRCSAAPGFAVVCCQSFDTNKCSFLFVCFFFFGGSSPPSPSSLLPTLFPSSTPSFRAEPAQTKKVKPPSSRFPLPGLLLLFLHVHVPLPTVRPKRCACVRAS